MRESGETVTAGGYKFLFDVETIEAERVFHDPSRMRRRRVHRAFFFTVCLLLAWAFLFFGGMGVLFERFEQTGRGPALEAARREASAFGHTHHTHGQKAPLIHVVDARVSGADTCTDRSPKPFSAYAGPTQSTYFGHLPVGLEWAPLSLPQSCGALSVLIPDWVTITTPETGSSDVIGVVAADLNTREDVESYLAKTETPPRLMPTVRLGTRIDTATLLTRLTNPAEGATVARALAATATRLESVGLCLDFNQLDKDALLELEPFFARFTSTLRESGLQSCLVLSETQKVWENERLVAPFDKLILKVFRAPWVGSPPGPLADDAWFEDVATRALATIGPKRLVLAIGNFAVEWTTRKPLPEMLPYAEALSRIGDAEANLTFSSENGNSFSSYRDRNRSSHKLWLLDAVSAHNQILTLKRLGIRDIAIWSLGREDPAIWKVLNADNRDANSLADELSTLELDNYVAYRGKGAFLRVAEKRRTGLRTLDVDPITGRFDAVRYWQLPHPYELERYGQPRANKLVLTFDDGPDPVYTTAMLDILKETGTPGAFFVVGRRVMDEPDLLNRIISDGHEIGAHTFTHPRMDLVSEGRNTLEHAMLARLIAGYTGHKTLLYREPFMRAGGPIEASRVRSLERVQNAGGIISGMDIVPEDWEGWSSQAIVDYVVSEVNKGAGNVILLHDGGENRTPSVEALPKIINTLRAQGYEFTTLADLLGTTRAELMPEVSGRWLMFDRLSFEFMSLTWLSLETIFWAVLVIGVVRMLFILILARIRQRARPIDTDDTPSVCVVIPAYDEDKAIVNCIESVLASDYPNFEVVVIDDGSQDDTFNEILRFRNNPRVQIYAQLNQGKAAALNAAVANTDAEIMVCIDADTVIDPQAIGHLARQFANPRVGAVAGKITVGNRRNLLTRLQALEYVTAQNFDRRAYDLLNGILVVPGAIGAWRTAAVREAGRYRKDTLTEDADLTIAVNRAGYRVTYEDKAIAYTNAPETVRQLLGQRLRWTLGMFQCAWKHKHAFVERRAVGLISIPDMLIFGYLFPLLAPIADAFILLLLYNVLSGSWSGEVGTAVSDTPGYLILAYMILPLFDLLVAAYALKTDGRESMKLLWLFPFQRFFYRQLLYYSVYRSVLRALTGSLADWGRVRRRRWGLRLRRAEV